MKSLLSMGWLCTCCLMVGSASEVHAQGKLKLLGGPKGAEVVINGASMGELPLRHAVVVTNDVDLVLRQDGEIVYRERLAVSPGQRLRHQLPEVLPAPGATTAPSASAALVLATATPQPPPSIVSVAPPPTPSPPPIPAATSTVFEPTSRVMIATSIGQRIGQPSDESAPAKRPAPDLSPARVAQAAQAAQDAQGPEPQRATEPRGPASLASPTPEASAVARVEEDSSAVAENKKEDDDKILDLLILESFAGPSFMAMALRRNDDLINNLASLPAGGAQGVDLNNLQLTDVVETVSQTGTTVGGAASLRLAFLSLGGRLSYSSYSALEMMTPTFELAFRAFGDPVELYIGFGLGAAFMYNVKTPVTQRDGMSLRAGLGLSYRFTSHASLGLGADAVGWFLAGKGISPAQLGEIDQNINHPVGGQVPIQANFSVLL